MIPLVFDRSPAVRVHNSEESASQPLNNQMVSRQAWLRAMEQSQLSGWFQPFSNEERMQGADKEYSKSSSLASASAQIAVLASPTLLRHAENVRQVARVADQVANSLTPSGATTPSNASLTSAIQAQGQSGGYAADLEGIQEGLVNAQTISATVDAVNENSGIYVVPVLANSFATPTSLETVASDTLPRLLSLHRQQIADLQVRPAMPLISASKAAESLLEQAFSTEPVPLQSTGVAAPRDSATRLHAVWNQEGLSLWLGMDGRASQIELQAAMLVNTLRQTLCLQGQRLQRVVCNGQVIFDASIPGSEPTVLHTFSNLIDQQASLYQVAPVSQFFKESP
ncbi:hypothetical protein ACFIQG_21510 [Comamonas odontotermitis]|uniref:hypothetical protein n=1 Tax=Comamonas odontotermitis TaxID=379895 RepID=UPI00366FECD7